MGTPVIFGIIIIVLVFLPLMTLQGMEGKMFSPLAVTIAIALLVALVVSRACCRRCYAPTSSRAEAIKTPKSLLSSRSLYLRLLNLALGIEKGTIMIVHRLSLAAFVLFPLLGKSFIPIMKEGAVTPVIIRVPSISLEEAIELETEAMKLIAAVPGVKTVVSKLGRGESPADPASQNESDPIAALDLEGSGRTQQEIEEDIRKALEVLPGVNIALSQPIAQRVDEMVTGVRSQVAVKIFGDDLEELRKLSEQVARIVKSTRGRARHPHRTPVRPAGIDHRYRPPRHCPARHQCCRCKRAGRNGNWGKGGNPGFRGRASFYAAPAVPGAFS